MTEIQCCCFLEIELCADKRVFIDRLQFALVYEYLLCELLRRDKYLAPASKSEDRRKVPEWIQGNDAPGRTGKAFALEKTSQDFSLLDGGFVSRGCAV